MEKKIARFFYLLDVRCYTSLGSTPTSENYGLIEIAHFFDFNKLITNFVVHFSSRQLNELLKFENWKDFSFSCPMRHLCTKSKAYIYIYIIFDNEILIMDNKFENQKIIDCLRIMFRIQQSSTGQ
jgi:hypothetical protein